MATGDDPVREWKDVVSHRESDHITLDPVTVAILAGELDGCPGCRERDAAIAGLQNQLALYDPAFAMRLEASRGR